MQQSMSWPILRRNLARAHLDVLIAADESIRRSSDPYLVAEKGAADVAVLKVQPLGGVRACLEIAERIGLPVVVSSALETSVGLQGGLALAAALPELPYACGLNTSVLLADDVVDPPLVARDGFLEVGRWTPDPVALPALRRRRRRWAVLAGSAHGHPTNGGSERRGNVSWVRPAVVPR